jgi:hypothetical protein
MGGRINYGGQKNDWHLRNYLCLPHYDTPESLIGAIQIIYTIIDTRVGSNPNIFLFFKFSEESTFCASHATVIRESSKPVSSVTSDGRDQMPVLGALQMSVGEIN